MPGHSRARTRDLRRLEQEPLAGSIVRATDLLLYARQETKEAIDFLKETMRDTECRRETRLMAASIWLDRAYGRPAQMLAIADIRDPDPINLDGLTPAETEQFEALLLKAAGPARHAAPAKAIDITPDKSQGES